MNQREAILSGTLAAGELLDKLDVQETVESGFRGSVDVFNAIIKEGARLVFRPLDGLLGVCIGGPGVMISTNRTLPVQRFTGAHELCHVVMHHSFSIDGEEILTGKVLPETQEIELQANSFAAEFLLPRWLFVHHARQQSWDGKSMEDPINVYQMSLRVGASYGATVRSLEKHKIINPTTSERLLSVQPKTIKQKLLPGYSPKNWYRDVWLITNKDKDAFIEGHPDDLFRFQLKEMAGAGYIWDFDTLKSNGFVILNDEREQQAESESIGADLLRNLTAHLPRRPKGELHLGLKRPWQTTPSSAEELQIKYNLLGKETGLARTQRTELVKAT